MSKPAGFVSVAYHLVGKFLLVLGGIGIILLAISKVSRWFALPTVAPVFSLAAILVGLYLIFIVPREPV